MEEDVKDLKAKFNEISNYNKRRLGSVQPVISDGNGETEDQFEVTKSWKMDTLNDAIPRKSNGTPLLTRLLLKQLSPSMLDLDKGEEEDDEEMIVVIDSNTTPKVVQKIRLSNNIVRLVRGPFKTILDDTMHAIDVYTEEINMSDSIIATVKRGFDKQKLIKTTIDGDNIRLAFRRNKCQSRF